MYIFYTLLFELSNSPIGLATCDSRIYNGNTTLKRELNSTGFKKELQSLKASVGMNAKPNKYTL